MNVVNVELSSHIALVIWGLSHSIIAASLLVALLSHLSDFSVYAKLGLGIIAAGCFARAYGFWTGVKANPSPWDLMVACGLAGMAARLAMRGINNHQEQGECVVESG